VETTIYASMDSSHAADVAELAAAVGVAASCNADIADRQSAQGDLGEFHQHVRDEQAELDRLQDVVDDKTEANSTKWGELSRHMQMISEAPACPGLPARTMPALNVYFEKSDYSIWFSAQQSAYNVVRDAFVAADEALEAAIQAYNIQKAVRDTRYCDWKSELEAACAAFDKCFSDASDYYTKELVPRVTSDMNGRIEVKKAGDTLVHQIKFLLSEVDDQQTPPIDTSRYELTFPDLPAKGLCDLSPLDAEEWVPKPSCAKAQELVWGCTKGPSELGTDHETMFTAWGSPRKELADVQAGEAICCADGAATRFDASGACTTPNGEATQEAGPPSYTFDAAKEVCASLGQRLCRSQAEVDLSCHTGCHYDHGVAWIEAQ